MFLHTHLFHLEYESVLLHFSLGFTLAALDVVALKIDVDEVLFGKELTVAGKRIDLFVFTEVYVLL